MDMSSASLIKGTGDRAVNRLSIIDSGEDGLTVRQGPWLG